MFRDENNLQDVGGNDGNPIPRFNLVCGQESGGQRNIVAVPNLYDPSGFHNKVAPCNRPLPHRLNEPPLGLTLVARVKPFTYNVRQRKLLLNSLVASLDLQFVDKLAKCLTSVHF